MAPNVNWVETMRQCKLVETSPPPPGSVNWIETLSIEPGNKKWKMWQLSLKVLAPSSDWKQQESSEQQLLESYLRVCYDKRSQMKNYS